MVLFTTKIFLLGEWFLFLLMSQQEVQNEIIQINSEVQQPEKMYLHIAQGIAPVLIWFKYTSADCLRTVVFLPHRRSTNCAFAEVVCGAALASSQFFSKNLYFSALYEVYFLFAF